MPTEKITMMCPKCKKHWPLDGGWVEIKGRPGINVKVCFWCAEWISKLMMDLVGQWCVGIVNQDLKFFKVPIDKDPNPREDF